MKITLASFFAFMALAFTALGQDPTPPSDPAALAASPTAAPALEATATPPIVSAPVAPPVVATATPAIATATPAISVAPTIAPTASPDTEEEFDRAIERKIKQHFSVNLDGKGSDHDIPKAVIPIVLISVLAVFGTPIAVVGLIMYFSFSKSRNLHKTVRMMVEKGQPVPEALLNPPPVVRQRSDLRRGVVLLMIGAGLMVFFGAVNNWDGGAWSLGIIPFLIGAGYLLVWRLDVRREDSSPKV